MSYTYTQIFGVYSKNITGGGGGVELCPIFLCLPGRGGYTQIFGV